MTSIFTYKNYNSKKDIWDADEKARDTRNYTIPEQALESLNHIMKRYLKLKDFKIYPRNSSFNDVMDDVLNTLCFDTEFQNFAK